MQSSDLPDQVLEVIERKCAGIVSLQLAWKRSASRLMSSDVSEANAAKLVERMGSPRDLDALVTGLAQEGRGVDVFFEELLVWVDESNFRLEAWIEAFEVLGEFLRKAGRSSSPTSMINYVHCTAEFASSGQDRSSLPDLVESMLEQYGFDGDEGRCSSGVE